MTRFSPGRRCTGLCAAEDACPSTKPETLPRLRYGSSPTWTTTISYLRQSLWQRRRNLQAQAIQSAYINVQLVIDVTTQLGLARKITGDLPRILGHPAGSLARFIHDHRAAWL